MNLRTKSVDQYLRRFPTKVQRQLRQMRRTIQKHAPGATEKISYGMPTFALKGTLVHFAGYSTHLGFYPGAKAIRVFKAQLKRYETAKGTIRFPLDKALPLPLVAKIVRFRVKENARPKKRR